MDFSLFFINYTFLTLFVVIISNRIMKYIHLLITMTFCYFFHVGLWQRIDKIEEKDVLVLIFKIRLLPLLRISLPKSGFLSAERKIVWLKAENVSQQIGTGISENGHENGMEQGMKTPDMKDFSSIWDEKAYKNTCHVCHRFRLFRGRHWFSYGHQHCAAFLVSANHPHGCQNVIFTTRENRVEATCTPPACKYAVLVGTCLSFCQTVRRGIRRISPLLPSLRSAAGWPTGLCQDAATGG